MRTDVTVNTSRKLRCLQIPITSPGRCPIVERGDWVEWEVERHCHRGRVVGTVVNPDNKEEYLVVILQMLGGSCCERWVLPADVIDARRNGFSDKAAWMYSDEAFLATPPDKARDCFNLLVKEMVPNA